MKKAFSLIELLIVIVIIGVVYSLSINKFNKLSEVDATKITLSNLKEYMQNIPHKNSVRFLCLDDCSACSIYVDDKIDKKLEGSLNGFLDSSVNVFKYDFDNGMQEKKEDAFFNKDNVEKNVCFSYFIDKYGVGDQIYVEFKNKVYDFTNYFNKTTVYDSLEDATQVKENLNQDIVR